jgi:hypothetical protein
VIGDKVSWKRVAMDILMGRRAIGLIGILLLWVAIFLTHVDGKGLTDKEYSELKEKLKFLNRPGVKSIYTEEGDIFDCVNIRNQPAFDHPLLKNHQIQMRPTMLPKGFESKNLSNTSRLFGLRDGGCPSDTVPVRRTDPKDLLRANSLSNFGKKNAFNLIRADGYNHHYAIIQSPAGDFYGTKVGINTWNPQLADSIQMSLAQIWLSKGSGSTVNTIEAGWQVLPSLYGDTTTRLFVYWTADGYANTGCYNLLCSGFVQISNSVTPGMALPVSVINGNQEVIDLLVYKDTSTGNWMLMIGSELVGYWPKSIYNSLQGSAEIVQWGGEIATLNGLTFPQMGSGRFPNEGYGYSAFMRKLEVVDDQNSLTEAPDDIFTYADVPTCYKVTDVERSNDNSWTKYFFFGGSGGNCKTFQSRSSE